MTKHDDKTCVQRRLFTQGLGLGLGVGAMALTLGTNAAAAATADSIAGTIVDSTGASDLASEQPERRIRLANAHTWEKLDLTYWAEGEYIPEALDEINHLMRDHRANRSKAMDIGLIDQLHTLVTKLETKERVHILSGYRTPETNAALRKRSNGVARYSLHMEARAIDLNIPGVSAKNIRNAAVSMKAGGVGYYARSGFVHIDTGRVRSW